MAYDNHRRGFVPRCRGRRNLYWVVFNPHHFEQAQAKAVHVRGGDVVARSGKLKEPKLAKAAPRIFAFE